MITYEKKMAVVGGTTYVVKLNDGRRDRIVGEIRCGVNAFQYFPKGSKTGGEIFTTLAACKQSLE